MQNETHFPPPGVSLTDWYAQLQSQNNENSSANTNVSTTQVGNTENVADKNTKVNVDSATDGTAVDAQTGVSTNDADKTVDAPTNVSTSNADKTVELTSTVNNEKSHKEEGIEPPLPHEETPSFLKEPPSPADTEKLNDEDSSSDSEMEVDPDKNGGTKRKKTEDDDNKQAKKTNKIGKDVVNLQPVFKSTQEMDDLLKFGGKNVNWGEIDPTQIEKYRTFPG